MSHDGLIKILEVPSLGLSVEEVTVVEWLIGEGDSFEKGDEICEIETEKTVNVMEAPFGGTLRKILAQAGEVLPVQAAMALVADAAVTEKQIADYLGHDTAGEQAHTAPTMAEEAAPEVFPVGQELKGLAEGGDDSLVHATPRARRLAAESGVNLHNLSGSGRNERISRRDVERVLAAAGRAVEPTRGPERQPVDSQPLDSIRRRIASRLQASKQTIPHYRLVIDVRTDALVELRREMNERDKELKISLNDLVVKACAGALLEVPAVNIQFDGKNIHQGVDADIAIAVALEHGLITPVIRAAQNKTLVEIARETGELVKRAQSGALAPDEYQGGTFCISNLGMYGVRQFDAIINPPHGAILAVGAVRDSVAMVEGHTVSASTMTLTMSCDHRVIDGAVAARFLEALRHSLETPVLLAG